MSEGEPGLDFRDMAEADLADGLRLSRASGWNQTLEDWRLLLSLGPGLFRVAVRDGRVVATGGAVRYGDALAWICMILVEPESRGHGLGTRIFDEVLERCEAEVRYGRLRGVGLDATPAGRPLYERAGLAPAYPLARFEAEPLAAPEPSAEPLQSLDVRPLAAPDLERVLAWDREAFGADRAPVLRRLWRDFPERAWCAVLNDTLAGYVLGREGLRFGHIGPLVARDAATAEALVRACRRSHPGRAVGIDAPSDRPEWRARLAALGFQEKRPFTRMYRAGQGDPGRRPAVFAIAGPELG